MSTGNMFLMYGGVGMTEYPAADLLSGNGEITMPVTIADGSVNCLTDRSINDLIWMQV